MVNRISFEQEEEIFDLIYLGFSLRQIADATKHSINTVHKRYKFARDYMPEYFPKCKCGKDGGHKEWCSHRYWLSESRQEFMKRWHNNS
jgi:hypothetical protein